MKSLRTIAYTLLLIIIVLTPSIIINCYRIVPLINKYGFHTKYIKIEQEIKQDSYIENTFFVKTEVWVINLLSFPITLEYDSIKSVKPEDIDNIKYEQYAEAEKMESKLVDILYK